MKRVLFVSTLGVVLAACGGGGGGGPSFQNPDDVHFTYGTPATASGSTETAAMAGEAGAGDTLALTQASDDAASQSLANLPDTMASAVFAEASPTAIGQVAATARRAMSRRAAAYAVGDMNAVAQGFENPACVVVTDISVTYNQCKLTETDTGGTATLTVDGSLTRGLTDVAWDVSVSIAATINAQDGNITVNTTNHLTGKIAVSEAAADLWEIKGFARDDASAKASGQGQSVSLAFTHDARFDLDYQPGIECVVDGTIELKRVWAERPQGATATDLPNLGILFDWNGCGVVQVSWGTL